MVGLAVVDRALFKQRLQHASGGLFRSLPINRLVMARYLLRRLSCDFSARSSRERLVKSSGN
jgi:hypothetical protein